VIIKTLFFKISVLLKNKIVFFQLGKTGITFKYFQKSK